MSRNPSDQPSRESEATGEQPSAATSSSAQPTPNMAAAPHPPPPDPLGGQPTVISSRPQPGLGPAGQTSAGELGQQLVGVRLAHFQLTEFVGGGGMGAVFRATDTMLNRTVAVKVLSRDQGQDEETVKRFRNEAQSAARLDHENIARVYFVGEDDGWYFIVFEFIDGQNLRDLVADQGALSLEQSLNITLQVAAALDHAARREVVHRDIKPSNVLLTASGRAKLVDMGLARLQPMRTGEDDLTASGVTLGTFDYISPEQARDPRTADVRSDIYSLGCTLFFMLTGRPPFARGTVLQKLLSHSAEPPPDPRNLRPDLPDDLRPVLSKMLAKSPADRYGSPSELMGELLILAERLGLPTVIHAQPVWIPEGRHRPNGLLRHLPWVVPICLMGATFLLFDPTWLAGQADLTTPPQFVLPRPTASPDPTDEESWRSAPAEAEIPGVISPLQPRHSPPSVGPPNSQTVTEQSLATSSVDAPEPGNVASTSNDDDRTTSVADRRNTRSAEDIDRSPATHGWPANGLASRNKRIVVTSAADDVLASEGSLVVRDLAAAFQLVLKYPQIETIELRENGRLTLAPLSLDLTGRALTLVAADGYSPVLSFRTALSVSDPAFQGMLQIFGGHMSLKGLHLELTVPIDTLEGEWSLFQLEKTQHVSLRDCTVTVRNSYGKRFSNLDHVCVFHVVQPLRDDMLDPQTEGSRLLTEIDLSNCVVRGEATVLRAKETVPLRLKWHNGLLVTTERLVNLGGARKPPERGERILLDLEHLTAVMDQGLGEFSSRPELPYLMEISVWCTNSVLLTQRWAPLITQSGSQDLASQMAQLEYFGEHNFYEGMETFWKIVPPEPAPVESFDFETWRAHWAGEYRPAWQRVKWQNQPDRDRPAHEHRVADYTLDLQGNPAIKSSSDHLDAGFLSGQLPRLPEPETELPQKTRPLFQY